MIGNRLIFADSVRARSSITLQQRREINRLYLEWAEEMEERASYYEKRQNVSSQMLAVQARELHTMLVDASHKVSKEIESLIAYNMLNVAEAVARDHVKWMSALGFNFELQTGFVSVPEKIVERLVTGQVYQSNWSLSKAIWSYDQTVHKQAYEIVAGGLAQNKPIYKIAKDLEQWVNPNKKNPWNLVGASGRRIYPHKVDYCAQRLARTLMQHSYQQSFYESIEHNPLITGYIWRANGSRVCERCAAMDGKTYPKSEWIMDHPNGMCVMEPVTVEDWKGKLRNMLRDDSGEERWTID